MAKQYRVTYADNMMPCDNNAYFTVIVRADSEEEATAKADACLLQDRFDWCFTESEAQYQYELNMLESGGFYGIEGDVQMPELHDAHCCDAGHFPF